MKYAVMVPLKVIRQRYLLADQVFNLSSVEVESPQLSSTPGPSPLSQCTSAHDVTHATLSAWDNRRLMLRHRAEDLLWLGSAFFILYYGDFRSNFFSLVATDARVWRTPLHIGSACLALDCCIILYIAIRVQQRLQLAAPGVIEAAIMVGLVAFILICIALWPIWNFLTIPMLFTLFMAFMVVAPYVLPYTAKVKLDLESKLPQVHSLIIM